MIRIATVKDAEEIALVHVEAWQTAYRGIVPDETLDSMDVRQRADRWRGILERSESRTYVNTSGGRVSAWISVGANRDGCGLRCGEIWALYVSPAHWRQGLGSRLMKFADELAREAGWDEIVLWVLKENMAARAFYEEAGFVADGSEKRFQLGEAWLDETRYRKRLGPAASGV